MSNMKTYIWKLEDGREHEIQMDLEAYWENMLKAKRENRNEVGLNRNLKFSISKRRK